MADNGLRLADAIDVVRSELVEALDVVRSGFLGGSRVWKDEGHNKEITPDGPTMRRYTKQEKDHGFRLVFQLRKKLGTIRGRTRFKTSVRQPTGEAIDL